MRAVCAMRCCRTARGAVRRTGCAPTFRRGSRREHRAARDNARLSKVPHAARPLTSPIAARSRSLRRAAAAVVALAAGIASRASRRRSNRARRGRARRRAHGARSGQPLTVALRLEDATTAGTPTGGTPAIRACRRRSPGSCPPGVSAGRDPMAGAARAAGRPARQLRLRGRGAALVTRARRRPTLAPGATLTLAARADWLVCKEICIPEGADLDAHAAGRRRAPPPIRQWAPRIGADARRAAAAARRLEGRRAAARARRVELTLTPPAGARRPGHAAFLSATTKAASSRRRRRRSRATRTARMC